MMHFGIDPRKNETSNQSTMGLKRTLVESSSLNKKRYNPFKNQHDLTNISNSQNNQSNQTNPYQQHRRANSTINLQKPVVQCPISSTSTKILIKQQQQQQNMQTTQKHTPMSSVDSFERINHLFDIFIDSIQQEPLHIALEKLTTSVFNFEIVNCWIVNDNIFYLPKKAQIIEKWKSLIGICYKSKNVTIIKKPHDEKDFDKNVDSSDPTLLIPVIYSSYNEISPTKNGNDNDKVLFILQIVAPSSSYTFGSADEEISQYLFKKLSLYSHFYSTFNVLNYKNIRSSQVIFSELQHRLMKLFNCRAVEIWANDVFNTVVMKYNESAGKFVPSGKKCGVVNEIFQHSITLVNLPNVKLNKFYEPKIDGNNNESVLMHLMVISDHNYVLLLRGKREGCFGVIDERVMTYIVPLIVLLINSHESIKNKNGRQSNKSTESESEEDDFDVSINIDFSGRLRALLEVAEIISGVLDIDILIPTIMERACSLLNTERCSLFLVDQAKQELVTRFHGGLNRSIRIPMNRGIVGHTVSTGNIVNITDAYSDPRFDKHVDMATGFKTKTILAVPIYNNRGEIAGVTEMINKFDDQVFDEDDMKMLMAFNVFCGISLDNAKLYTTSLNLTRQLRSFVEMSSKINHSKQIHSVLEDILMSSQSVINATRATIFMNSDGNELLTFVTLGDSITHGTIFAQEILIEKKPKIFSREEIFIKVQTSEDKPIDGIVISPLKYSSRLGASTNSASCLSRVTSVLISEQPSQSYDPNICESICGMPLMSSDGKVLGVIELSCNGKIMPEDLKLLDCFAVFASVSIERSELQEIAVLGHAEVQLKQYLTLEERKNHDIPAKMKINKDIYGLYFDSVAWNGIGHFKVLWAIVDSFNLLKEFKIPNEKWFHFMIEISQTYKKVPYHNWIHAVDVTQFVTYEIKLTKLDQKLTKFELLGFIISAICHDANHDGFTNVYNEKAETPLGILFKNQSVMETHHCTVAISVISKEECNLFSELDADEYKSMWSLIFQLILVTDMAKHFGFLKSVQEDLEKNGPYNEKLPEHRLKMMQMILKCGDISNVSRPFELADKWCDVLCEEFFRQGELEMAHGMEYTSPLNDRTHLDKPKSQIGFYTFVCLPLYQLGAKMFPELQVNVDQVLSNLSIWKSASEEKIKKEESATKKNE